MAAHPPRLASLLYPQGKARKVVCDATALLAKSGDGTNRPDLGLSCLTTGPMLTPPPLPFLSSVRKASPASWGVRSKAPTRR